ncbi:PREDICTED: tumor necrosis factor ligand superfamily member 18 [Hipposideros armiger]|uniref:Tumor necrosis factor ligand superfamily member 18 n=1 Tax=Hipposideros armiger TaxID=186990 RepID=A0A8B7RMI8_HIPAR|nr:PREDICTED: tumor necrosis factor ligand superfamily member 18 [Hipposideros armiger]XP_019502298.1 PREDICTED: tumor necrosis factor ligand superfamily member 18 [Hipposideros armiger]XP_019502306.1 PREDICTED: tumor necrosis factor ligand superfamily member 18 [Hipposideros armiger]
MSLRHMENMPFHHSSPPGAQRTSWKPWIFYSTIVLFLLLCSLGTLVCTLLPFKTGNEHCAAKFGPLPSRWQMTPHEPPCVNQVADWKLEILHSGLYLTYVQVAPNTAYKEPAPFEVRLYKNEGILQTLTNNATIQNVGGIYEFHAGDIIDLLFNSENQVLKNNTYWGLYLIGTPQFVS